MVYLLLVLCFQTLDGVPTSCFVFSHIEWCTYFLFCVFRHWMVYRSTFCFVLLDNAGVPTFFFFSDIEWCSYFLFCVFGH